LLGLATLSSKAAQTVTGNGTDDTISPFTGPTTIGDSRIFQLNGKIGIGIRARVSVQAHDSLEQIHFIFVRFPIAIGQRSRPGATASAATGSTTETAVDDTAGCSLYAGCAGGFGREKAHARIFR
jgi:hypothetical protein